MRNKLEIFIIIGAFLVAIFYLITRKEFQKTYTSNDHNIKRKFITMVALIIAFLSCGKNSGYTGTNTAQDSPDNVAVNQSHNIENTEEWIQLKAKWTELKDFESKGNNDFNDLHNEVEKQKKNNEKLLSSLVRKGYLSNNVAFILNYVYGEILFHKLRSTSGWTCYFMSWLGEVMAGARGSLQNQLQILSEISAKDKINKNVLDEAQNNIAKSIEFMNQAESLFNKQRLDSSDEQVWEEQKALAELFKNGKIDESVKATEDVKKAAGLIVKLQSNAEGLFENSPDKLQQLKGFKEWKQIKSNWFDVLNIRSNSYNTMQKTIAHKKKENDALLNSLIATGIFGKEGAKIFNDLYGKRIFHHIRPMVATCYEPTMLGAKEGRVRDNIEKRLQSLEDLTKQGKIDAETLAQAATNLQKEFEITLIIEALWKKQTKIKGLEYQEEEKKILSYFNLPPGKIELTLDIESKNALEDAMEIIKLIYLDSNM